jgi:hypothetical protein
MLCMLDEDTVCEPHPAAEELFVLNNKVQLQLLLLIPLLLVLQHCSVMLAVRTSMCVCAAKCEVCLLVLSLMRVEATLLLCVI